MPSKEETSEKLHALLEEAEEIEEAEVEPIEEEEVVEEVPESRSSTREYIVLQKGTDEKFWLIAVGTVEATSAEGAIRSLGSSLEDGSVYVAVPKRNWNPVPVKIKTTTIISFT